MEDEGGGGEATLPSDSRAGSAVLGAEKRSMQLNVEQVFSPEVTLRQIPVGMLLREALDRREEIPDFMMRKLREELTPAADCISESLEDPVALETKHLLTLVTKLREQCLTREGILIEGRSEQAKQVVDMASKLFTLISRYEDESLLKSRFQTLLQATTEALSEEGPEVKLRFLERLKGLLSGKEGRS
jgi:hypothetical protein